MGARAVAPARRARAGKVLAVVPLTFDGKDLAPEQDLREVLPADVLAAVLERGEAKTV